MFGLMKKKPKAGDEEHRYYLLPGMVLWLVNR